MRKLFVIFLLLMSLLLLSSCAFETYMKNRSRQRAEVDTSPPAIASQEEPFVSVKEFYILPIQSTVTAQFSFLVHTGNVIGFARMEKAGMGDLISCKGPGGTSVFSFVTDAVDLNYVNNKIITMYADIGYEGETQVGTYNCEVVLYDDLGQKVSSARFDIKVVEA